MCFWGEGCEGWVGVEEECVMLDGLGVIGGLGFVLGQVGLGWVVMLPVRRIREAIWLRRTRAPLITQCLDVERKLYHF